MKVTAVIDRFEGSKAVLLLAENEIQAVWPREYLPQDAVEGDYLELTIQIDRQATQAAREEADELLRQLQQDTK